MPSLLTVGTAIIAASSRPRRRSSWTSVEFCPISSTRTPGCRASTSATRPAPAYSRAVPNMPNRMVPVSSATTLCTARRASSDAASVRSACGRSDSAAVVATTPRPTRRNSVVPERLLQGPDLLGDRRLGVAEVLGGRGERAVLVRRQEAAELVQGKHRIILGYLKESEATPMSALLTMVLSPSAIRRGRSPHVRPHCTACDKRQLIFPSQITGVASTAASSSLHLLVRRGADRSPSTGARRRRVPRRHRRGAPSPPSPGTDAGFATGPRRRPYTSPGCPAAPRATGQHAALAQSVEHLTRNEKVVGSIPTGGSAR